MNENVVICEQAEDGAWGARRPDLPVVVALGTAREEAAARIPEGRGCKLAGAAMSELPK